MFTSDKLNTLQAKAFQPTRPVEELYDLENDPKQERPIVNDEVTQNLLKAVTRILNDHDAPSEMYEWYNLKLAEPA